jgi:hypothetical protein
MADLNSYELLAEDDAWTPSKPKRKSKKRIGSHVSLFVEEEHSSQAEASAGDVGAQEDEDFLPVSRGSAQKAKAHILEEAKVSNSTGKKLNGVVTAGSLERDAEKQGSTQESRSALVLRWTEQVRPYGMELPAISGAESVRGHRLLTHLHLMQAKGHVGQVNGSSNSQFKQVRPTVPTNCIPVPIPALASPNFKTQLTGGGGGAVSLSPTGYTPSMPLCLFLQSLIASGALDTLLDHYMRAASPSEAVQLEALLASCAHPSSPPQFPRLVAHTAVALGALLARDPLVPAPTARRTMTSALAIVKHGIPSTHAAAGAAGGPPSSPATPAAQLEVAVESVEREEAALARAATTREQIKAWTLVLDAAAAGVGVLQQQEPSKESHVAALLQPLADLQDALQGRLQVRRDTASLLWRPAGTA